MNLNFEIDFRGYHVTKFTGFPFASSSSSPRSCGSLMMNQSPRVFTIGKMTLYVV